MHINPTDVMRSIKAYQDQSGQTRKSAVETKKNSHLQRPDEVILSSRGAELGHMVGKIKETTDIRQDKVSELAAKVQSGTYHVSAQDIAAKMLDSYKGLLG